MFIELFYKSLQCQVPLSFDILIHSKATRKRHLLGIRPLFIPYIADILCILLLHCYNTMYKLLI